MKSSKAAPKLDRKTVEKNRRTHMKLLLSKLDSLLPNTPNPKEVMPMPDRLDEAAKYIKELHLRVEKMKEKRQRLVGFEGTSQQQISNLKIGVEVQDMGSGFLVFLLSHRSGFSAFCKALQVLEEAGTEVMAANFISGALFFSTIHCSVVDNTGRGFEAGKVAERLKKVVIPRLM
ncbi:hypothetical protein J5N97_025964 [Dioscorea zingiberensis]|uniref:BHLH domain-containing protein n=1 Tax=Dioscorea zingiberensis TaxID=325984 RepID=A0A9D5C1I5_9LILI|nr:hypothetical protein J5N97_025964 [Dioscorea zingiberensis]